MRRAIVIRRSVRVVPLLVSVRAYEVAVAASNWPQVSPSGVPSKLNSGAAAGVERGSTAIREPFDPSVPTSPANGTSATCGVHAGLGFATATGGACATVQQTSNERETSVRAGCPIGTGVSKRAPPVPDELGAKVAHTALEDGTPIYDRDRNRVGVA
jgi:hypothetical protein